MNQPNAKKPVFRKLKAYAFDPSLSLKIDTAQINCMIYKVFWEELDEGPTGEYIEVIDYDPTIKKFYTPVNLNHPFILAQDGQDPSESNPQFHQQMVYAVAMLTIKNFEKALGRKVLWAPRLLADKIKYEEYVPKLRVYPHALRNANAYYSPQKKALLFGYFSATPVNTVISMPDALVFTCLSHDIVAHEVTHAILDGMHSYYNKPTNPDVLAFHEAFSDLIALFQHFTFPEVLKHQIAQTRGDLASQNLLGKLAQEFGAAIGSYGSLRDAIGEIDPVTKEWKPKQPNPSDYQQITEPHARGSILVAAVFEAFINIYRRRISDLLRIATNGSGILPQGELHPDLVNRLAGEASTAAGHVLSMCIRALDYCPPVDITFGDYLRAVITADADLVKDDDLDYRLAFIDAFRRRGIYPEGIKTLSEESLKYPCKQIISGETKHLFKVISEFLKEYRNEVMYENNRERIYDISKKYLGGSTDVKGLHQRIHIKFESSIEFEKITGLVFNSDWSSFGVRTSYAYGENRPGPSFSLINLRLVSRVGPDGNQINYIMVSMIQRVGVLVEEGNTVKTFVPDDQNQQTDGGFQMRGGCTLIFDLDSLNLKYAITKPVLDPIALKHNMQKLNLKRVLNQYQYQVENEVNNTDEQGLYFTDKSGRFFNEPFSFLHSHL